MTTNDENKTMLRASYEFENGRARMMNKGVVLWNGSENDISADNPMRIIDALVYEMIGADEVWSDEYELTGVKITVEIDEIRRTWPA